MPVTLRDATAEDQQFLLRVYATTRAAELELTPWTADQRHAFVQMQFEAQLRHYSSFYSASIQQVILSDREPVGRLYLNRTADEIQILDVTVLPDHRGRGIGSAVIEGVLEEARLKGWNARIYVDSGTPYVGFFERRGFCAMADDGVNTLMMWRTHDDSSRPVEPDA